MRHFVSNCFKFLGLFLGVCFIALIFNSLVINYYFGYKIKPEQNILILGDSHTECAINDSIFKNSINLSHSADSYFYSFLKIRKMKKENPQIDTLLLALSNHNLLIEYDDRWLFNTANIKSKFRIYTDLMDFNDFMFLLRSNPSGVTQGLIEAPKYSVKLLLNGELQERDLGGFFPSNRDKLLADIAQLKAGIKPRELKYSQNDKKYLLKIIDFCESNDIKLFFLGTPLHPEYSSRKTEEFKLFEDFYKKNLQNIDYLNYTELAIPDNGFQDTDHLNANGAKLFTEQLMQDLRVN